jgi:hypothetical protein
MTNIDPELAETVQHVPAPKAQDAAPSHQASTTKKNNFNLKFSSGFRKCWCATIFLLIQLDIILFSSIFIRFHHLL